MRPLVAICATTLALLSSACADLPGFTETDPSSDDDDDGPGPNDDNDIDLGGGGVRGDDDDDPVDPTGRCGNGQFDEFEVCDDGNSRGGDGCSSDCREVDPDFLCLDAGDPCTRVVTCGNGVLEGNEQCDDGPGTLDDPGEPESGDGCSDECEREDGYTCIKPGVPCVETPVCGNGVRERGEQCDDAEATPDDGDGCDSECQLEDGFFCSPGQACVPVACGDGNRTPGEQCDDGPGTVGAAGTPVPGDGCSATCTVEEGFRCSTSGCGAICGDGLIRGSEECDDNDKESGDGCSAACRFEPFFTCDDDEPTVCVSDIACGDGDIDPGEVCDWAIAGQEACYNEVDNPGSGCKGYDRDLIDPPVCGNHVIEVDEECDGDGDGNASTGACVNCVLDPDYACPRADYCFLLPACGNGIVQAGEACDPGAMSAVGCVNCQADPDYYCVGEPSTCVQSICGDAFRAPDEQCDDGPGNLASPGTPVDGDGCSASCTLETGWVCPPGIDCIPRCGDDILTGNEECEEDSAACVNCKITPGYDCDENGQNCFETECGNGTPDDPATTTVNEAYEAAEAGEGCDDGNFIAGDGCGPTCQKEPSITRPEDPVGSGFFPPKVATTCGDGLITGSEACDDGNTTAGDGCAANCLSVEDGWDCDPDLAYPAQLEMKITYRDFRQRTLPGGHPHMKNANVDPPQSGGIDANIVGVRCTTATGNSCGLLDFEGKPVYNSADTNNHIDPSGDPFNATQHAQFFSLWYRNTNPNNYAGVNGTIAMCANPPLGETCSGAAITDTLVLTPVTTTTSESDYFYQNLNFWPLGYSQVHAERGYGYTKGASSTSLSDPDADYGNEPGEERNFHFTSELRYFFKYQGGETLTFFGDDDVWVFVNGRLAVDLGGIHGTEWGRVVLGDDGDETLALQGNGLRQNESTCSTNGGVGSDINWATNNPCTRNTHESTALYANDDRFGLTVGGLYEIVIFQAERHPTGSNYRLTLDGFLSPRSNCYTTCGDGERGGTELCDDGEDMPASGYEVCKSDCTFEYCGDALPSPGNEDCDDGFNVDTYGTGCAPGCEEPGYCGDGVLQSSEETCDDGVNDGSYNGCAAGCDSLGPYCGDGSEYTDTDGVPPNNSEACDTPGEFTNYDEDEGACRYDCQPAGFCGDQIRNGDELCDFADPEAPLGCNSDCAFDPVCGDGITTDDEECDYGTFAFDGDPEDAPYGSCTTDCLWGPRCGDDTLDMGGGEECDDGNLADGETSQMDGAWNRNPPEYELCTTDCIEGPRCGDGVPQTLFGEACDNGFNEDDYEIPGVADACGPDCAAVPYCGDGEVQSAYELCDNGSANDDDTYDGCTESCEWGPYCGDGETNGDEECDDGAGNVAYSTDGEGCSYSCARDVPYCGDGIRNGSEQCDNGEDNEDDLYGGCQLNCTPGPRCGDYTEQEDEACDDGPSGSATCTQACQIRSVIR